MDPYHLRLNRLASNQTGEWRKRNTIYSLEPNQSMLKRITVMQDKDAHETNRKHSYIPCTEEQATTTSCKEEEAILWTIEKPEQEESVPQSRQVAGDSQQNSGRTYIISKQEDRQDRQTLAVLRPVNRVGSYQGETNYIPATSTKSDSLLNTHSIVEDCRNVGKTKLNEPGREKLGS